jgi:UPF0755 protein
MRRIFVALGGLAVIALLAVAVALLWGAMQFESSGPLTGEKTIVIPHGTGIAGIADRLEEAGLVEHSMVFQLGARWFAREKPLQAGEYRFAAGVSPHAILDKMIDGDTVKHRLTLAEGLTSAEILALVRDADGLVGDIPPGIADLPEGSLLPETYFYSLGDSRADLVKRMERAMQQAVQEAWAERAKDLEVSTPEEAVVLASIVEKETAIPAERPRIARVFMNRLKKGMKLQSDPTVIYAVTKGKGPLGRPLSRADLKTDSPYNTYATAGLPPGPIANPGRDSIAAVLQPAEGKDLYFVADGGGGHAFAATLAEHNRNVAKLRKLEQAREADPSAGAPPDE